MKTVILLSLFALSQTVFATSSLSLKSPGRHAVSRTIIFDNNGTGRPADGSPLPLSITRSTVSRGDVTTISYTVKALETCHFNLSDTIDTGMPTDACDFYMPGFWYHRNLRSPKGAPSFTEAPSWSVREDRLSTPLTAIYDQNSHHGMSVMRLSPGGTDCVHQHLSGEIILPAATSVGFTGFDNTGGKASLVVGFPWTENPHRYIRKLTLIDPATTFMTLHAGQSITLDWQIKRYTAADYSDFVSRVWEYSFDTLTPAPVQGTVTPAEAKACMADYFKQSYVDSYPVKFFSGHAMRCDDCASRPVYQVGFVGRLLLNAFNAAEYAGQTGDRELQAISDSIFSSILAHGFTPEGYIVENAWMDRGDRENVMSIRRQSEGAFATLFWLDYEKRHGRRHPEWENRIKKQLDRLVSMQNADGSFPRKFNTDGSIVDHSGGSTPSATLPLAMAYHYFGNTRYLDAARLTAQYLEHNIIDRADYFSSTLDANCEDKEAALYATTAMYYLARVTDGKEQRHYLDECRRAAYFALSWYYLWDVPFAPGQMLGDVDFKSRGWGNVSVENNHIDVYIFEFTSILDHLAEYYGEPRFARMSKVIATSMLQLMPTDDDMYNIARKGYYPEVVQHTTWDYGHNGKGFYNDIFAPGWTVASLWQMLTPTRLDTYLSRY